MVTSSIVEILPNVIGAAPDGKIVGKIRLQKIFYLLDNLGLGANLKFSYHHYGPYSDELSTAVEFAKHFNSTVEEEDKVAVSHGGSYSIFRVTESSTSQELIGQIRKDRLQELLEKMTASTSVVIELAATIHWLKHSEGIDNWNETLKARKPSKTSEGNVQKACHLLEEIGLAA